MAFTDEQYRWLSEQSYWVDSKKNDKDYTPKEGKTYPVNPKDELLGDYKVLEAEDNPDNGMQAMVSKRNGNVLVLNYKLRRFYDSKKESHHFIRNGSNFSNGRYGNV